MDFFEKLELKITLDALAALKIENPKENYESKAVIFAKTFDKLSGKLEPFFKKIQMNQIYKIVVDKYDYSTKDILEFIVNAENKNLQGAKNIASEILKDQEQLNKFQLIVSND